VTKTYHDSETLAQGQQVFTACAFIHCNFDGVEKVFLPKRAASKKFLPSVYELPGGHIDFGEDIVAGLKREINEEFGMIISVGAPFYVFTYTNKVKGSHSIEVIYFAKFANTINNIRLNTEDHSDYGWFAENELEKATTPGKKLDDAEFLAMQKGFRLIRGEQLLFA
jgi:8-oxo-dGTP pyrophosphatase MutT (NUDIX family)